MTDREPPSRRWGAAALIAVLAAAVIAVVVVGVISAGPAGTIHAGPSRTVRPAQTPPAPTSAPPSAAPSKGATARSSSAPTPQPTRSVGLATPATIVDRLTARVSAAVAVSGVAQGPGEVAGPAVRFTVVITNATGKAVNLGATVVNAYYGAARTPATPLAGPGGRSFPASVAAGSRATGSFVFGIPENERGRVLLTVDTSVGNPVVAFTGSAPRS